MGDTVLLEVADGVGTVTLNRPKVNAINRALQEDLIEVAAELARRDDVRAVVVTGGPRVFAAGADIEQMVDQTAAGMREWGGRLGQALDAVAALPKPTVAAINGYALGGGCELALATDVRFAADNATLGQPEILLGVIPGAGGTQRLTRLVGPSVAKDLVYTGRFVPAEEALRIGLVDRVLPAERVLEEATEWARRLARGPALALAAAKRAVDEGLDGTLADGLALEQGLFAGLFDTEDQKTGMRSFLDNGPGKATFAGR